MDQEQVIADLASTNAALCSRISKLEDQLLARDIEVAELQALLDSLMVP